MTLRNRSFPKWDSACLEAEQSKPSGHLTWSTWWCFCVLLKTVLSLYLQEKLIGFQWILFFFGWSRGLHGRLRAASALFFSFLNARLHVVVHSVQLIGRNEPHFARAGPWKEPWARVRAFIHRWVARKLLSSPLFALSSQQERQWCGWGFGGGYGRGCAIRWRSRA